MSKIHIVTDSAADIDPAVARQLDITVLPLRVRIDDQEYQDGVDLSREELFSRMMHEHAQPEIVGPSAEEFREVYTQLTRQTNQIISIHSSASLSLVHQEAERAAQEFLGRCDIITLDSETLSLGLSILAKEAAKLSEQGTALYEIVRQIRGMIRHIYIVLITDTLDYLEHSGLISPSQAVLGTMLDIKPFLDIEEGAIIPMEKVRNRDRAVDKLTEFAGEFSTIEQMAILQSTFYTPEETKMLRERLDSLAPDCDVQVMTYGPLLASHIGFTGLGLVVYEGLSTEILL
jgi:DegV family protein with EDD domain